MLVSFCIENWMSFRDKVKFSMLASRERQHNDRVSRNEKYGIRVLPIAALYGGNASGKTNLFKAVSFAKDFIVNGTKPDNQIRTEPFLLNSKISDCPSKFVFEIISEDNLYEFSFSVTRKQVIEEKLVLIEKTSEKILYHRKEQKPNFHSSINKKFLEFAFDGTRDNQLFLTNSVSQKVDLFRPIYNWFKDNLRLVAPDTRFGSLEQLFDEKGSLYQNINQLLPQLDTGISRLSGDNVPFDSIQLPEQIKQDIISQLKEGVIAQIINEPVGERFLITKKGEKIKAKKLVTYHLKSDGTEAKFEAHHESDGSKRTIDLLPLLLDLFSQTSKMVYIIDEIDRSLHTLLTRSLLESYLSGCSYNTESQLLFTTHDVLLMDQKILRRDEMWVTERDSNGVTDLFSISEYKEIRFDKDIRKSYLLGRLGGIPRILLSGNAISNCLSENESEDE